MGKGKMSRREFLKAFVATPVLLFLSSCAQALGIESTNKSKPTATPTPTATQTTTPTATLTPEATATSKARAPRSWSSITHAIIHHSAGQSAQGAADLAQLAAAFENKHHFEKSWAEEYKTGGEYGFFYIEYHWLIANDGSTMQVQDLKYIRPHSHNDDINNRSIAICLVGDFRSDEEKKNDGVPITAEMSLPHCKAIARSCKNNTGFQRWAKNFFDC